ncbi:DnaJ family domain-containing protein [Silvimonas iriomotensis]|uniref:DnaJ homologue subfamily C member 28 conserved domain-containing protein n=1 Tax=Silvimonas iriomotensis TaxID=449662 RepID=A0ABQ2P5H4_9NEIS|nr:DnaJ family domain-containing protein [Silvimonas iriomotensis]GGP18465.1 hypothetical protein GCM10010970_05120 [Silvimonas iriomotensis]
MWFLTELAERRIAEARDQGELDNLPGAGKPLPDDEIDPLVPEHQRLAFRVLKNSGFLPPELEMHKEAVELAMRLATSDTEITAEQLARLEQLNQWLTHAGHPSLKVPAGYLALIEARLSRRE